MFPVLKVEIGVKSTIVEFHIVFCKYQDANLSLFELILIVANFSTLMPFKKTLLCIISLLFAWSNGQVKPVLINA